MRPWRSLTHLPSFRSIAGIISILFFLFRKSGKEFGARTLEQGGLSGTRCEYIPVRLTAASLLQTVPDRPPCSRALLSADRKSTRLNSSHVRISYAVFC